MRSATQLKTLTEIEGTSVISFRKSRSTITSVLTVDVAVAVAVRGAFVRSAISPSHEPAPS